MGSDCGESLGDGNFEGFQQAGFGSAQQFFRSFTLDQACSMGLKSGK
jgi:hypothetical protein